MWPVTATGAMDTASIGFNAGATYVNIGAVAGVACVACVACIAAGTGSCCRIG